MSKLTTHPVFIAVAEESMTHQRNAKLKGVLPVILVMGIILFMSTLPVDQAGEAIQQVSGPPRDIIRQVPAIPRSFRLSIGARSGM
jgi:hypothetical protein